MEPSDIDRLREYRALGTLGGMTSAGVVFAAYFMEEIFKVTQQTRFLSLISWVESWSSVYLRPP